MQPEHFFVARGNSTDGYCPTPHKKPRPISERGVCRSCANWARARIKDCSRTDEGLVAVGFWLPKANTLGAYVERLAKEKQSA